MSYTISLSVAAADDRSTATLLDSTTYGGSNPARSAVRVYAGAEKMKYDNTVDDTVTMVSDTGNPATVTSWQFSYDAGDGWWNLPFVIIKDAYNSGTTYALYDAVYDGSNNVYRSKQAGNVGNALANTTYWELITDPSSLAENEGEANESANIESLLYQRVLTFDSQYEYGNFLSSDGNPCCGDCSDPETCAEYEKLSLLVNAAIQCDIRTLVVEGEKICRKLESIFNC